MNRARGELGRRRQEAYRARAAATLKIQRWYRQRRAIRARTPTNDDAAGVRNPLELPAEESRTCTGSTSTSATLITTSQQEIPGDFPLKLLDNLMALSPLILHNIILCRYQSYGQQ